MPKLRPKMIYLQNSRKWMLVSTQRGKQDWIRRRQSVERKSCARQEMTPKMIQKRRIWRIMRRRRTISPRKTKYKERQQEATKIGSMISRPSALTDMVATDIFMDIIDFTLFKIL
jgi:hypothetical protein